MARLLTTKLNLILGLATAVFLISYILFSSLSTSLDFNIEKLSQQQLAVRESYEQLLAVLAQANSQAALTAAGAELKLVEITLADGYLDLRPPAVSAADNLARQP